LSESGVVGVVGEVSVAAPGLSVSAPLTGLSAVLLSLPDPRSAGAELLHANAASATIEERTTATREERRLCMVSTHTADRGPTSERMNPRIFRQKGG